MRWFRQHRPAEDLVYVCSERFEALDSGSDICLVDPVQNQGKLS